MKRILLILAIMALAAFAFAANPRGLWWELRLDDGNIMEYVDSQDYFTNSSGWRVEAIISAEPEYLQSTDTHINYLIKVFEGADAMPGMAWVYVDQQKWTEDWAIGDTLTITLTWLPTGKSANNSYVISNLYEDIWLTDHVQPGATWVLPSDMFIADAAEPKQQD